MLLKYGLDIQSQTKVSVIWLTGGYFENGIDENHQASAQSHKLHAL